MSAFAVVLSRDGSPVPAGEFDAVFGGLDHRGVDGRRRQERPACRLGHQHFWTTPEEVGERQPVEDREADLDLLFEGRLDNRAELLAALGVEDPALSDARLLLRAWREWRGGCLARLLGPFVFVVREGGERRFVCARDALGDRTLFWAVTGGRVILASEEAAILRHPSVPRTLDDASLARYFAIDAPRPGATFFAAIRELPPGHVLVVDDGGRAAVERYWRPPVERRLRLAQDADYAERFHELLVASVRCRLRATGTPAVLMSGGLDSTSIAALAQAELPAGGGPLRTISWVFDELEGADERRFIQPMVERFGFAAKLLPADGGWPLRDPELWRAARNAPLEGPFRSLAEDGYREAREGGSRVLLTGEYGDHLFAGGASWLRDLLEEDRLAEAASGLVQSLRPGKQGPAVTTALARAVGLRPRRRRRPWLTRRASELLAQDGDEPLNGHPRPEQTSLVLGARAARGASGERANACRSGIDVRQPYRDRRLVDFMLSVPAHLLYRPLWSKWLLREAMRDSLPAPVRLRRQRSSLSSLFDRGLAERESETVKSLLGDAPGIWRRFVRSDWLDRALSSPPETRDQGVRGLVSWYCVTAELWVQGLAAQGLEPQVG